MSTRIIGLHSGHDASACLLVDNVVVGAIARERLTRRKHDQGDPVECVDYLLTHFGLAPADIDLLVCSDWHDATACARIAIAGLPAWKGRGAIICCTPTRPV
ncbi:hypothetical protein THIX_40118 [Thiomonas sp. X19]|uniref:carbamoyltransferase N-terminal domain-containing protein n=1 Tax=Thiomonas sp. X19 TaxID=1050370 RepID=UPI000B63103A|nr:carbamoyltransferase N-terminal domain-containing protein [Thiomonas sp. X19]SCC93803.1 hypothetical protein THIX_40118 [Thiomonas sp. X19]